MTLLTSILAIAVRNVIRICRYSLLFEVCAVPLCFYERLMLVPVFTNQKKFLKRIVAFMKKKSEKQKQHSAFVSGSYSGSSIHTEQ